ncbi:chromosome segregation SMC family protein [Oceanithermus sp.]|uniref:chromosome segregation SMC family protein n=1 Tax=Oceanithermus sp. TaxID=2268145 RepID=UPI0025801016|nr:chromosome segregation SMC family protein [Oceanithermus sp.]
MKIERLTLHGFKSFADRVELHFDRGISGVIGPNGSGKSNVVEAIRFVMGSRARALRAREAEALIFHGGDGRKPMPFAEVELVLRDGRERYVVSRRIDRSGDQDVRLNGKRATFRQIERVLAGTGLGKNAHALVGQGEVANILESSPDALIERLEDAAGLRVVTLALRETRQRLERAARHLESLREQHAGRLAEKARLTAEAEEARRAEALARERLAVQRGLFRARRRALEEEIGRLKRRLEELEEARVEAEKERLAAQERGEELERERSAVGEAFARVQARHAALESERGFLERERLQLRSTLERLAAERSRLDEEAARLAQLKPPEPPTPPGPEAERERLIAEGEELAREVRRAEEAVRAAEQAYAQQQRAFREYREALARYEAARDAHALARKERDRWERVLAEAERDLKEARTARDEAAARDAELRAALAELQERAGRLRAELEAARREADRLEKLVAGGSDLAEGPRRLVRWRPVGMLGVVADLLEVPPGLEAAAEAALGARIQWVLMEDERSLREAVARLKREGGRATLLARDLARPRTGDLGPWLGREGVVGAARELFAIRGERKLTDALFGDTLVVEDLDVALALAREKRRVRMVTLAGEVVEPLGSVSGGRAGRGGGARLELRGRLRRIKGERDEAEAELRRSEARIAEIEAARADLDLGRLDERLRRLRAERDAAARALERLPEPAAPPEPPEPVAEPDAGPLEAARRRLEDLGVRRAELEERLEAWKEHDRAVVNHRLAQERYEERQERLAALRGRAEGLDRERGRLEERLGEVEARLGELAREQEALGLEDLRGRVNALEEEAREAKARQQTWLERLAAVAGETEEARLLLARREATLEEVLREGSELPPGEHVDGSVRKLQLRLREIERELEGLGPVNHRAAQALEQLQAELGEVERALAEADEAARKLTLETEELREAYDRQLQEAFVRFRERFAYYGRALLGGLADVKLDEEGLHLVVQPQGKRTRDLRLLSAGEKTMGALGFLFALAEVGEGSLPIAVLDEVDAPLDESNILRFVGFLRDFARQRQFILVTHQKRTMEACDVLWGVTNRGGASLVYSLRREEAGS